VNKNDLNKLLDLELNGESPNFVIYSEKISPRLTYVAKFIFEHVLKVKCVITNTISEFENSNLFKINYSSTPITHSFQINPHSILFETGVSENKPAAVIKNELIYFFENIESNDNLNFSYDIFSSVFYFISRYEEWQFFEPDTHGRFEAKSSLLFQKKMNLIPVVDHWIIEFKNELQRFYPKIKFPENKFKIISTIDVDNLYAYKAKGFLRTIGAIVKDILKFDLNNLKHRINVLTKKEEDPFDIYTSNSNFCFKNNIPLIYFFLFRSSTKYDRTVNPNSDAFVDVFRQIKDQGAVIGLHPSYYTSQNKNFLKQEVTDFSEKIKTPVKLSRQHYLKFNIKTTPQLLLENGIIADFTMGFASDIGFRAGTSFPFYYYDLDSEKQTDLLFVPFCAMDGAFFIYDKLSPDKMLNSLLDLANEVKKVNGFLITVFHERTFSGHLYPGYDQVYKKLFQKINAD
jgi:hypothetical protein